jgi:RAB protein geranylgeranyltransferase component A
VQLLTNEFIKRVCKFVKSAGIHTKNPYLYTNYGTGDIAQGFARISAVSGSVFVLNNFI